MATGCMITGGVAPICNLLLSLKSVVYYFNLLLCKLMWYIQCINRGIQWNPSKTDIIGEVAIVFYEEVSFVQEVLNYDSF